MSISVIISFISIALTFFIFLIEEDVIKLIRGRKKSWFVAFTTIALLSQCLAMYFNNKENEADKAETARTLKERDSLNIFKIGLAQKKYEDSLKAYSLHTQKLLAEYGLRQDKTGDRIIKAIDSNVVKGRPFLTYAEEAVREAVHGDTLVFWIRISNTGTLPAINVACTCDLVEFTSDSEFNIDGSIESFDGIAIPSNAVYTINARVSILNQAMRSKQHIGLRITGSYKDFYGKKYSLLMWYTNGLNGDSWGAALKQSLLEDMYRKKLCLKADV